MPRVGWRRLDRELGLPTSPAFAPRSMNRHESSDYGNAVSITELKYEKGH